MSNTINEHTLAGYAAFNLDGEWITPLSPPERHAAIYAKEIVRLRAALSEARTDTKLLDAISVVGARTSVHRSATENKADSNQVRVANVRLPCSPHVDCVSTRSTLREAIVAACAAALRGPSETKT